MWPELALLGKAERQITVEHASGPRGSRSNPQIRKVAGRSWRLHKQQLGRFQDFSGENVENVAKGIPHPNRCQGQLEHFCAETCCSHVRWEKFWKCSCWPHPAKALETLSSVEGFLVAWENADLPREAVNFPNWKLPAGCTITSGHANEIRIVCAWLPPFPYYSRHLDAEFSGFFKENISQRKMSAALLDKCFPAIPERLEHATWSN